MVNFRLKTYGTYLPVTFDDDSDFESSIEFLRSGEFSQSDASRTVYTPQSTKNETNTSDNNKSEKENEATGNELYGAEHTKLLTLRPPIIAKRSLSEGSLPIITEKKDTKLKWKRFAKTSLKVNCGKNVGETKTTKLRAEFVATKMQREGSEEHIRNVEREIESLKKHADELKAEILTLQERNNLQENKLTEIFKERRYKEENITYFLIDENLEKQRIENTNRMRDEFAEVIKEKEDILKESKHIKVINQSLQTEVNKLKMSLGVSEASVSSLQSECVMKEMRFKQTKIDLEDRKKEIETLTKFYEERFNEKEVERLNIENQNKEMLDSLKSRCDATEKIKKQLNAKEKFSNEQSVELNNLISLISDLEIEKGKKEEEITNLREKVSGVSDQLLTIQEENKNLKNEIKEKKVEIDNFKETVAELTSSIAQKSLMLSKLLEEIDDFKLIQFEINSNIEMVSLEKQTLEKEEETDINELLCQFEESKLSFEINKKEKNKDLDKKAFLLSESMNKTEVLQTETESLKQNISVMNDVIQKLTEELEKSKTEALLQNSELVKSNQINNTVMTNLKRKINEDKENASQLLSSLEFKTKEFSNKSEKMKRDFDNELKMAELQLSNKQLQIQNLEENIDTLATTITELKTNIKAVESEKIIFINQLQNLKDHRQEELASIKNILTQPPLDQISKQEEPNIFYKKQCLDMEYEGRFTVNSIKLDIQKLFDELTEEKNNNKSLSIELNEYYNKNLTLNAKMMDASNKTVHLNDLTENLREELKQLRELKLKNGDQLSEATLAKMHLQERIVEMNIKIDEIQNQIKMERKINEDVISSKEKEIETQKELIKSKSNMSKIQTSEIQLLDARLTVLNKNLLAIKSENDEMKTKMYNEETNIQKVQNSNKEVINKLQNSVKNLKGENSSLKNQQHQLEFTITKLQDNLHKIEMELDLTNHENTNLLTEIKTLKNEKETIKKCFTENNKQLMIDLGRKDLLHQQRVLELRNAQDQYEIKLNEQQLQMKLMEDQLSRFKEKIKRKNDELQELKLQSDEKLFQIHQKSTELRDGKNELCYQKTDRIQADCRRKIVSIQVEKETEIQSLERTFEDKVYELKCTYEDIKDSEIQFLHNNYEGRLADLEAQRRQLITTLKKLESLNLQQKLCFKNESEDYRNEIKRFTQLVFEMQKQRESLRILSKDIIESLKKEIRKVQHNDLTDGLMLLTKLERLFDEVTTDNKDVTMPNNTVTSDILKNRPFNINNIKPLDFDATISLSPLFTTTTAIDQTRYLTTNKTSLIEEDNTHTEKSTLSRKETPLSSSSFNLNAHCLNPLLYIEKGLQISNVCTDASDKLALPHLKLPHYPSSAQCKSEHSRLSSRLNLNDSGFTETSIQSISCKKEMNSISNELQSLDEACGHNFNLNRNSYEWVDDAVSWKFKMQERFNSFQAEQISPVENERDKSDGFQQQSFSRCVLFYPSKDEVKTIINKVNQQYNRLKESLF